ncbi:MAG TPA: hypothetical protein VIL99_16905 [Ignavibacteria bacterium]
MKKLIIITLFSLIFLSQKLMSQIHTETIEYKDGDVTLEGYIAYDESLSDIHPGATVCSCLSAGDNFFNHII